MTKRARGTKKWPTRIVQILDVAGRPGLSAGPLLGKEAWDDYMALIVAALAAAGEVARVDKSVVRKIRRRARR